MGKSGLIKLALASVAVTACVSGRSGSGTNTGMGTGTTTSSTTASSTTGTTTTTTSGGDVSMGGGGLWNDGTSDGMWMDTTGSMRMGGRRGRMVGLQAADISRMNNQNVVAHLATGDSLEIALSQLGVSRAQNSAVRDFAQRMVTEHTAHMQMGNQLAQQNGITPMPMPGDTMDVAIASRMMAHLTNDMSGMSGMSNSSSSGGNSGTMGNSSDRQLMMAEVAMHRHMLKELTMLQPQATGAARQLVDQTIPVVRQHLTDAQGIWRQVGGGNSR
jgi:predicted outer membrane protein